MRLTFVLEFSSAELQFSSCQRPWFSSRDFYGDDHHHRSKTDYFLTLSDRHSSSSVLSLESFCLGFFLLRLSRPILKISENKCKSSSVEVVQLK